MIERDGTEIDRGSRVCVSERVRVRGKEKE